VNTPRIRLAWKGVPDPRERQQRLTETRPQTDQPITWKVHSPKRDLLRENTVETRPHADNLLKPTEICILGNIHRKDVLSRIVTENKAVQSH